ncbi:pyridoxamine 5'-phosphate oxidase family protein [Nocardia tenerifensis]|uniref:Pyridoxamine 5'-phosphate oxidase family protein n=1 Tax=Nocardia tenerifensis TaxID=228006 RepID=A0A318KDY5_9NOCA|nr:PPOX class F420-dependent oxidoreductase [Nocardia tenerifensis]PXX64181.1 pyridoxamine 5'-phosphate oxidase family protein [Nocardia tenerifensis]
MIFTDAERGYLSGQRLARLATVSAAGAPQIVALGFRLNDDDTIDIGGPNHAASQRYRNILGNPKVSLLIDDMTPDDPAQLKPGWGRGVEIRGVVETLTVEVPPVSPEWFSHDIIRVHPRWVRSWHIDPDNVEGGSRKVG